jgi:hypothetical protein
VIELGDRVQLIADHELADRARAAIGEQDQRVAVEAAAAAVVLDTGIGQR